MEARWSDEEPRDGAARRLDAIHGLVKAAYKGGVSPRTLELVHLRASQINGRSACVDSGRRNAKKSGETDERLWSVAAWREAPYFSEAERAAAGTGLAGRHRGSVTASGPTPCRTTSGTRQRPIYDEKGMTALILWIATTNFFNRLNSSSRSRRAPREGLAHRPTETTAPAPPRTPSG